MLRGAQGGPQLLRAAGRARSGGGTRGQATRGGAFLVLCEAIVQYSGFWPIGCFSAAFLAGGRHEVNKLLERLIGEQSFVELIFRRVDITVPFEVACFLV